jgi:HemK-related putative methylase
MTPSALTCLLAVNMDIPPGSIVADLGCGCGIFAIIAAKLGAKLVYAIDMNPYALRDVTYNARINGVAEIVRPVLCDLRKIGRQFKNKFDVIVSNPPQMPTALHQDDGKWLSISRDGGANGKVMLETVISQSQLSLRKGKIAKLEFVMNSLIGIDETLLQLQKLGFATTVIANTLIQQKFGDKRPVPEGFSKMGTVEIYERAIVVHAIYRG